jgi:hypothetical protein
MTKEASMGMVFMREGGDGANGGKDGLGFTIRGPPFAKGKLHFASRNSHQLFNLPSTSTILHLPPSSYEAFWHTRATRRVAVGMLTPPPTTLLTTRSSKFWRAGTGREMPCSYKLIRQESKSLLATQTTWTCHHVAVTQLLVIPNIPNFEQKSNFR